MLRPIFRRRDTGLYRHISNHAESSLPIQKWSRCLRLHCRRTSNRPSQPKAIFGSPVIGLGASPFPITSGCRAHGYGRLQADSCGHRPIGIESRAATPFTLVTGPRKLASTAGSNTASVIAATDTKAADGMTAHL